MKDGFVKVAAIMPAGRVADPAFNTARAAHLLERAAKEGVVAAVLPELYLTGYTCGDLFYQPTLLQEALKSLQSLCAASCRWEMLFAVGLPVNWEGKLYNAAAVCCGGKILGIVPKTWLPNTGSYYERRWFAPAPAQTGMYTLPNGEQVPFGSHLVFRCKTCPNLSIGVEIGSDADALLAPSIQHAAAGATVILNPSADIELPGHAKKRRAMRQSVSSRLVCGYLYAGAGVTESTTDAVYGGRGLICENGTVLEETLPYEESVCVTELDVDCLASERLQNSIFPQKTQAGYTEILFNTPMEKTTLTRHYSMLPFLPESGEGRVAACEETLQLQAQALARRMNHVGAKTAVLGISGGLDSTMALLVAVRAMKLMKHTNHDIVTVTMPCFGTSSRTLSNAGKLCKMLGCRFMQIDIKEAVEKHFRDIGQSSMQHDTTYENCQARERTQILMDLAGRLGGIVVGTGDLSELALGWATYNGDHMSMYGINASIPKTMMQYLVSYEAARTDIPELQQVLKDILETPISPELLPPDRTGALAQKTEQLVGPYELHDFFIYYVLRYQFAPTKVLRIAQQAFGGRYNEDVLKRCLVNFYQRFFAQQFKRSCLPDGPKASEVSLSPRADWKMPSDAVAGIWLRQLELLQ